MARLRLRTILITSFSNNYEYQRQISKRPCMVLCGYYSYRSILLLNIQRYRGWKILSCFSHWFYNKPVHIHLHTQKGILSSRESTGRRGQERVSLPEVITTSFSNRYETQNLQTNCNNNTHNSVYQFWSKRILLVWLRE